MHPTGRWLSSDRHRVYCTANRSIFLQRAQGPLHRVPWILALFLLYVEIRPLRVLPGKDPTIIASVKSCGTDFPACRSQNMVNMAAALSRLDFQKSPTRSMSMLPDLHHRVHRMDPSQKTIFETTSTIAVRNTLGGNLHGNQSSKRTMTRRTRHYPSEQNESISRSTGKSPSTVSMRKKCFLSFGSVYTG